MPITNASLISPKPTPSRLKNNFPNQNITDKMNKPTHAPLILLTIPSKPLDIEKIVAIIAPVMFKRSGIIMCFESMTAVTSKIAARLKSATKCIVGPLSKNNTTTIDAVTNSIRG